MNRQNTEGYAVRFEMCASPWRAGIILFDDCQAKLNLHLISPNRPVLIQIEGEHPTLEQVATLNKVWMALSCRLNFTMATFCPSLLPFCREIMDKTLDGAA